MKNENEWLKDYEGFLKSEGAALPQEVKNKTFSQIKKLINPHPLKVFLKIISIHLIIGSLSLSVCHQFEMNPFNTNISLSDWLMQKGGHYFCMFGCGVLFVSLSLLASGFFLTIEEIKALKKTELLQTLTIGILSLGFFSFAGADIALSIALIWLLGGLIGGAAATRTIHKLKQA